jgi:glyoxylase-like metal-dependent hydrolase (beta-lactamase superfamily II)
MKFNFASGVSSLIPVRVTACLIPLEDELGDVIDKALRRAGLSDDELSVRSGVPLGKIRDAIDYRYDLDSAEVRRLASALKLNEVGLCALHAGRYPLPEITGLPFCVWPLRMQHGVGVSNAYLVGECGGAEALLFDVGGSFSMLARDWPANVKSLRGVFLTHAEPEHTGGLREVMARFGRVPVYAPSGSGVEGAIPLEEGQPQNFGRLEVVSYSTPGHAAAHSCYLVSSRAAPRGAPLLVAGDLLFAGSVGGAYHCRRQLGLQLQRMIEIVPQNAVVAPGHGPMTTLAHERRFNPFCSAN